MKRLHIFVYGKVQGVFFRYHTKETALRLGLKGYAKNLNDGSVEIVAEGHDKKLNEFLNFCKKGPDSAKVKDVKYSYEDFRDEFENFEIKK